MDADPKTAKSFTRFGPTAERKLIESKHFTSEYKEPFICLPDNTTRITDDHNQTVYCSYCPSQDHRYIFIILFYILSLIYKLAPCLMYGLSRDTDKNTNFVNRCTHQVRIIICVTWFPNLV